MAYQRNRATRVKNDIINVTEIENDLEELTLPSGINSNKPKTIASSLNGHVKPKYTDPLSSKNYKDPLKTISVKDPFAEKGKSYSIGSNKIPESALNNESVFARKTTQSSIAVQTGLTNGFTTQSGSHVTSPTTTSTITTPSRGFASSSTQLTRNQQFTAIQTSKRTNGPIRINKNQKGFSHEEKDMYIDDIEDF